MADLKDVLKDVLKHTHGLDIFESVKITGTEKETTVDTLNDEKTVILKGVLKEPVPEFEGETVGLGKMGVLQGFLNYEGFTSLTTNTQSRNGIDVLAELEFRGQSVGNYRFMLAEYINNQIKDIKFKGATFDVVFEPSQKNISDLIAFNSFLGSFESSFTPKTEDNSLFFYIGDKSGDRSKIHIADNIKGKLAHNHKWPINTIIKILKMGGDTTTMSITDKGLLKIEIDSGIGVYTYLLPTQG